MKNRLIIVDSHALGHQVKHSLGELTYDDLQIGVIYGFLFRVLYLARMFDTNLFAFAWDSRDSKRKKLYPEYGRKKKELTEDEKFEESQVYKQFNMLRENVLPALGFKNNYIQEGMEGDDIVASVVINYATSSDEIEDKPVVISSDNDLYQLLLYCDMYILKSKSVFTAEDFIEKYDVKPSQWADVKSLAGCSGDGVPGVPGVGKVKAIEYIKGTLNKGKIKERILTNPDLIALTRRLVTLPFEGTEDIHLVKDKFNIEQIIKTLEAYDMKTLVTGKNYTTWKGVFCDN